MDQSKQVENNRRECGLDAGHIGLILAGIGIGVGLMYILDPRSGRSRRKLIGDQVKSTASNLSEAAQSKVRDLRNRAQGIVAEAGSGLKDELNAVREGTERGGQTSVSKAAPSGQPQSQTAA